ncbi:3-deoxy-D-manno-octulosonic acid transferase [Yoonia sp. 208BN28-4]|uniref:3-deoxy-D-manno-octulosonic acid transferase n=1 Tax=Yoonia sp. 208BN28-4 TaxID=3126505 RepID=UPI0030A94413
MARPLPLAAYLALRGADDPKRPAPDYPAPAAGVTIWAVCTTDAMVEKAKILEQALTADGDPITLLRTCLTGDDHTGCTTMPRGRQEVQRFLQHWKPSLTIWFGDHIDPLILSQIQLAAIPVILAEASQTLPQSHDRHWIPGLTRAVLGMFKRVFAVDDAAKMALFQAGLPASRISVVGEIEKAIDSLPYNEGERRDFAETVGTRPIWLSAETSLAELPALARAHHQASRRSHRLLLIVALREPQTAPDVRDAFRAEGYEVAVRTDGEDVSDATQIYIVDGGSELGLWYRASPVTYLGETLNGQPHRHPFEAAALGTALVYGPNIDPFQSEVTALESAGGSMAVASADGLGDAVEQLLAADKVAQIVHAAWDVTTRGADVVQHIAQWIHAELDAQGGR